MFVIHPNQKGTCLEESLVKAGDSDVHTNNYVKLSLISMNQDSVFIAKPTAFPDPMLTREKERHLGKRNGGLNRTVCCNFCTLQDFASLIFPFHLFLRFSLCAKPLFLQSKLPFQRYENVREKPRPSALSCLHFYYRFHNWTSAFGERKGILLAKVVLNAHSKKGSGARTAFGCTLVDLGAV